MEAYGYIRVSGAAQAEKDGPKRQEDAVEAFCQQHGFQVRKIYSDLGVSGTIEGLHRPGLMELITESDLAGVKIIIVENMNRLARDLIVSEMIIRELKKRNIKLFATDLGLYDQVEADCDPSRKLIRQIFGAMAEYDKSALVLKLRASRERIRRETGRCEGRKGYCDSREGRVAANLIIQLRESGAMWTTIAALLNRDGLKTMSGRAWSDDTVRLAFDSAKRRQK